MAKNIFIDIDDTICYYDKNVEKTNYHLALPHKYHIDIVNKLYLKGYHITLWTARGAKSGIDFRKSTEKQLSEWGVMYHNLRFDKPPFDLLIDDKSLNNLTQLNNIMNIF